MYVWLHSLYVLVWYVRALGEIEFIEMSVHLARVVSCNYWLWNECLYIILFFDKRVTWVKSSHFFYFFYFFWFFFGWVVLLSLSFVTYIFGNWRNWTGYTLKPYPFNLHEPMHTSTCVWCVYKFSHPHSHVTSIYPTVFSHPRALQKI